MQIEPATTSVPAEVLPGQVTRKPEVMDDFLRNFFVKMGLARTCEAFEAEWYELKATGMLEGSQLVPDIYQRNAVRVMSIDMYISQCLSGKLPNSGSH